jgi:murein DD-endopeptidase MepM/ murein hydrolase activator NlpD
MRACYRIFLCGVLLTVALGWGCPRGSLLKSSPHETYSAMLRDAGLDRTALGQGWLSASEESLRTAAAMSTPFRETGYFAPGEATAVAYRMNLQRGRRLSVEVTFESREPALLFVDLFELSDDDAPRRLASLEPDQSSFIHEVDRDGVYVLRLQPELLRGGRFTITERTLASLRFPISGLTTQTVKSLFGADRDAGARRHEGIDIFAPRGTEVVAVTSGFARAGTNALGGNVVWLYDPIGGRTFYYAHLDRHAIEGMSYVREGVVLGNVGNTGNARRTPPHLHFGLYEAGAINPLPFLQPDDPMPKKWPAPNVPLGDLVRVAARRLSVHGGPAGDRQPIATLERNALARVLGWTSNWLRVELPSGAVGYLRADSVLPADTPIRSTRLPAASTLHERPAETSPVIDIVEADARVDVLGRFEDYEFLRTPDGQTGWVATVTFGADKGL